MDPLPSPELTKKRNITILGSSYDLTQITLWSRSRVLVPTTNTLSLFHVEYFVQRDTVSLCIWELSVQLTLTSTGSLGFCFFPGVVGGNFFGGLLPFTGPFPLEDFIVATGRLFR